MQWLFGKSSNLIAITDWNDTINLQLAGPQSSSSSSKRLKFQQEEYIVKERHDSTN